MTPSAPLAAASAPSLGGAALNLVLVLGLIFALAWLLRRLRGGAGARAPGTLQVKASLALSMKERVVLIDAAGEHLLLGVSPAGVTCLHRYAEAPPHMPAPESPFANLLKRTQPKERDDAR